MGEPNKWIILHTVGDGTERSRAITVNVDNILFIAEPLRVRGGSQGTKLTFPGGVVASVTESPPLIRGMISGDVEMTFEEDADE